MPDRRRARVNRHFKIDDVLPAPDREAYLAFLREPGTTIDLARAWLAERDYRDFSRSAVARHRRQYLESFRQREEIVVAARHYGDLARAGEFNLDQIVSGLAARHETLLAEALFDQPHDRSIPLKLVQELGHLVEQMVTTRLRVAEFERLRPTSGAPSTKPTPEEEHEAAVRRIREILGEPCPREGKN